MSLPPFLTPNLPKMAKSLLTIPNKPAKSKENTLDDLAADVLAGLNSKFKDMPNAFVHLSDAVLVNEWVSTGSDILDLAISNRPNAGLGYSTFVEISGLPGSGKSLLAAHILAETQKQGGLAVLFDTEKAIGMLDFYRSVGLDVNKALYSDKLRALEDIFLATETIIEKYVKSGHDRRMTIVVDSIMGATTNAEQEADYESGGYATAKAKVLSIAMRKLPSLIVGRNILIVFINQLKENLNAIGFGADPYKTTGGTAIPFTSHVRLRTKVIKTLKLDTRPYGSVVEVKVVKNRLGPNGRAVLLNIHYDSGIDNYGSWLTCLKEFGIVRTTGSFYVYDFKDQKTGEKSKIQFQSKDFRKLLEENPQIKDEFYSQICDKYIMKYRVNEDYGIDDVQLSEIDED